MGKYVAEGGDNTVEKSSDNTQITPSSSCSPPATPYVDSLPCTLLLLINCVHNDILPTHLFSFVPFLLQGHLSPNASEIFLIVASESEPLELYISGRLLEVLIHIDQSLLYIF